MTTGKVSLNVHKLGVNLNMGSSNWPVDGATAPYGPMQGVRGRVWQRDGWFTCYVGEMKTHQKNREIKVYWP